MDQPGLEDFSIEILSEEFQEQWNEFVDNHEAATAFHSLQWLKTVRNTFDYTSESRLIFHDLAGLVGVVPLFGVPEILGGSLVNPFCEYGYPLIKDGFSYDCLRCLSHSASALNSLIIKEHSRSDNSGYFNCRFPGVQTGVTFELPTTVPFEFMISNFFNRDLRTNLKKAKNSGLQIRYSANLEDYYNMYLNTMQRLGSPPFPLDFFSELKKNFGEDCIVRTAIDEDEDVAGIVALRFNNHTYVFSNASLPEYWDNNPNEYVYANLLKDSCNGDCELVDFGRTEEGSSLYYFKEKFGGQTSPLVSMVYPPYLVPRASISQYKRLKPIAQTLSPIISHRGYGPKLKGWIHE